MWDTSQLWDCWWFSPLRPDVRAIETAPQMQATLCDADPWSTRFSTFETPLLWNAWRSERMKKQKGYQPYRAPTISTPNPLQPLTTFSGTLGKRTAARLTVWFPVTSWFLQFGRLCRSLGGTVSGVSPCCVKPWKLDDCSNFQARWFLGHRRDHRKRGYL